MDRGRLLVLDDDPAIGRTIGFVAESVGFEVRSVSQASTFLQELDRWSPSHIAIDLVMPEMDGVEIVRLLAARRCRAVIIITSGLGSRILDAARRSAVEHGLDVAGVLAKPFLPDMVRTLLRKSPRPSAGHVAEKELPSPQPFAVNESELRRALREKEFYLVYQPKIECTTGRLAGFEALVRWQHPKKGTVMPVAFVPLAEATGLIDPLTMQVLDRALQWLSVDLPTPELSLSINLSAKNLANLQFADAVADRCSLLKIDPSRLIFEVTETSAMQDPVAALDLLTRLRMMGFQLSIDGSGPATPRCFSLFACRSRR